MAAKKETYTEAMARLEEIVRQIDANELELDVLADKLTKADAEIEKLLQEKRQSE